MLELLRKHQHGIMIVVAFMVIIAFAWFFNPYDNRNGKLNQAIGYTIGNEGVTVKEIERQLRMLKAADDVGMNFTMQLLQPTFDAVDFSQNRLILAREARKLGVDPSEEEVNEALAQHAKFRRNGSFSEDAYLDALKSDIEPNGLIAGDLRGLFADKIRWERVSELLSSGSAVPDSVVDIEFQRERELITASVVDFKLEDHKAGIEVTDEELQKFYDEQKALVPSAEMLAKAGPDAAQQAASDLIMAKEQRKVEFVFMAEPVAPAAPAPVAPGLTPPPLLQPGAGASQGALSAPPIPLTPAGDESAPPGQAPLEDGAGQLEIEELPTIPEADPGLTPADELNLDVNVGELGETEAPQIDLGGEPMNLDIAPEIGAVPGGEQPQLPSGDDFDAKLQAYKKQVDVFYDSVLESPDQFASLAQAQGLEVKTSELFTEAEPPASPVIPAELLAEVFRGSMDVDSGLLVPVQGSFPKGFYVTRLLEIVESKERSFEDAKEDLRKKLIEKKAKEAMVEAVKAAREKLVADLGAGKSFADAAKEQELAVRNLEEFSSRKRPTGDHVTEILAAVPKVTTGSVSELVEAGENALLVHVSQRVAAAETKDDSVPTDPAAPAAPDPVEEKKTLAERLERQAGAGLASVWLEEQRKLADIRRVEGLPRYSYFPQSLFGGGGFGQ